jgi:uncharacterized membrane protein
MVVLLVDWLQQFDSPYPSYTISVFLFDGLQGLMVGVPPQYLHVHDLTISLFNFLLNWSIVHLKIKDAIQV